MNSLLKKQIPNSDFYSKYQQFAIYTYEWWGKIVCKSFTWRIKTKLKGYTNSSTATAARVQSTGTILSCISYYSPQLNQTEKITWGKMPTSEPKATLLLVTSLSGADYTGISLIRFYKFSLQTRFMSWIIWQTLKIWPVLLPTCQLLLASDIWFKNVHD